VVALGRLQASAAKLWGLALAHTDSSRSRKYFDVCDTNHTLPSTPVVNTATMGKGTQLLSPAAPDRRQMHDPAPSPSWIPSYIV